MTSASAFSSTSMVTWGNEIDEAETDCRSTRIGAEVCLPRGTRIVNAVADKGAMGCRKLVEVRWNEICEIEPRLEIARPCDRIRAPVDDHCSLAW